MIKIRIIACCTVVSTGHDTAETESLTLGLPLRPSRGAQLCFLEGLSLICMAAPAEALPSIFEFLGAPPGSPYSWSASLNPPEDPLVAVEISHPFHVITSFLPWKYFP